MTSLFDLAAGLSQYNDDINDCHHNPESVGDSRVLDEETNSKCSTLSLLDETFHSIYATHKIQNQVDVDYFEGSSLKRESTVKAEIHSKPQSVPQNNSTFCHLPSIHAKQSSRILIKVPGPPTVPPSRLVPPMPTNQEPSLSQLPLVTIEPDVKARNLLRELSEELEHLSTLPLSDVQNLQNVLSEKYLNQRLVCIEIENKFARTYAACCRIDFVQRHLCN